MKRKLIIIILIPLSVLFSCTQLSPETQKKLDSVHSTLQNDQYQNSDRQGLWKVGQWSLYRTTQINRDGVFYLFDSSEVKGFVQILVAAAEDDMFWLELNFVSDKQQQHVAALIAEELVNGNLIYKIKQMKIDENESVRLLTENELQDDENEEQLSDINLWLNFLLYNIRAGSYRNAQLPAGQFLNVREVPITLSLKLGQMSGYVWYHSAVPVFPVAKFELTISTTQWQNLTETAELVDFGNFGQESYFSYE